MTHALFAPHALLPAGWARDVRLAWNDAGTLTEVRPGASPDGAERAPGALLPGIPNLHSHAFQRAFAGLSEYRGTADDSFWTWRDLMYRFALAISPDQLEDIATQLYIEMLRAGYTAVCEFHYLHHGPDGQRYADPAEMALRLVSAARRAGIGLTLLPVLYQDAGFGGQLPRADQRRFINSVDSLLDIVARARGAGATAGVAPHSIRAVGPQALAELLRGIDSATPVHIHIAEQPQEVRDCVAWSGGATPVQWLLANAPVDARWCLVHATHMTAAERDALAASGAVAGICPTTEANLGDGVFDAAPYLAARGAWGIGSDSHASVDAAEELRLFEYAQRLTRQRRNVLAPGANAPVAEHLWLGAVHGGARASGRRINGLAVGEQADMVVLDERGVLAGLSPSHALANHLFANQGRSAVRDVWVGGRRAVQGGVHAQADAACARFTAARAALLQGG